MRKILVSHFRFFQHFYQSWGQEHCSNCRKFPIGIGRISRICSIIGSKTRHFLPQPPSISAMFSLKWRVWQQQTPPSATAATAAIKIDLAAAAAAANRNKLCITV
jgi:hypothetical protein